MKRCAFLTMDTLDGYVSDDDLVYAPMHELGWRIDSVSWHRDDVDWRIYDAVLIRTTWDYHKDFEKFLDKLAVIDASTRLLNPLELVRWNINKLYLCDLEQKGIPTVPAVWPDRIDREQLYFALEEFETSEIVVKPVISAGARNTFRLSKNDPEKMIDEAVHSLAGKVCVIQPFLQNVIREGEFSVFYFGGTYSHTVLKTPKPYDFRVQEEHGGVIRSVTPEPLLIDHGREVLDVLDTTPLYARVDWVRDNDGEYRLMELELIEPSLYFRTDPVSSIRFAQVFDHWMTNRMHRACLVPGKR